MNKSSEQKIAKNDFVSVVVFSSDGYSDFWDIFFHFFFKNSGLTGLPIYLITGSNKYDNKRVVTINCGQQNNSWSDRAIKALGVIDSPYVIAFTEDLLCMEAMNINSFNNLINFSILNDITCVRLVPDPPPWGSSKDFFVRLMPIEMHRVSLQASLWNREKLIKTLKSGETPWQFEVNGTCRTRNDTKFFSAKTPLIKYQEVIGRGKVTLRGKKIIHSNNLQIDSNREIYSRGQQIQRDLQHLKSKVFHALPIFIKVFLLSINFVGKEFNKEIH